MRYLLFNDPILHRESRIYYTNLFRARYIAERKNDRAHGANLSYVIQHLKVGCTVHRSYFPASPGGSFCPIFFCVRKFARALAHAAGTRAKTCH